MEAIPLNLFLIVNTTTTG